MSDEKWVPLSVREGGRRKRLAWWISGRREDLAFWLAPWIASVEAKKARAKGKR